MQESAPLETIRHIFGIDIASGSADEAADRALNTVKRKLDKSLSVEYTVNELLSEATDTFNLANMFHGEWLPLRSHVLILKPHHRLGPISLTSFMKFIRIIVKHRMSV